MQSFERNGRTFPVRDSGPTGGAVAVLLHGFPQTAGAYDEVVRQLTADGIRTLVPTQRGYAVSALAPRRSGYTTAQTTADVVALLDAAGVERAHLVGHDWGAHPPGGWAPGTQTGLPR